jgi:GalNAc-alpha-(1->4)-GalNAc-alpha-(1->3)-diNAcBac-PP-undecaprenol alpha-1,4-N-acetyl-D-galactosaminyltransferase
MKLTLVISSVNGGGAERVMAIMASYWANNAWEVTVLTFDDGRIPAFYALDHRIKHFPLGLAKYSPNPLAAICNNLRRIQRLRTAIHESNPDCVISFMDQMNVLTLLATMGRKIPVVVVEQSFPPAHRIGTAWNLLRRLSYPKADRVVTVTQRAMSGFSQRIRSRSIAIPNPVLSPISRDGTNVSTPASTGPSIIAVGRLARIKGHDLLLRAFALLKDRHPCWSLTILGEGPQRQELESLRDRLALSKRVSMPGQVANPEDYLKQSSLFVMASRSEGFPMALCEAMASGLPVISTDCPSGPREIISDGEDGILVPNGDVEALAAAIDRLIADEEERKRLGDRASKITERFGLQKIMEMWEALLAEVVKSKR